MPTHSFGTVPWSDRILKSIPVILDMAKRRCRGLPGRATKTSSVCSSTKMFRSILQIKTVGHRCRGLPRMVEKIVCLLTYWPTPTTRSGRWTPARYAFWRRTWSFRFGWWVLQSQPSAAWQYRPSPLLTLADSSEGRTYNETPPTCVCYSFEWRVVVNGRCRTKDMDQDVVLAPSAIWDRNLRSDLQRIV